MKPFIICAPDGYIVDIYGLYPATWNDARILKHILETDSDLVKLFKEDDILFVDRGFRDAIKILNEKYKMKTMMPNLLHKTQKQFTSEEANNSRLCTKMRWVIESVNGLLKECFKALDNRVENKALKHFLTDLRIAGKYVNKYINKILYLNYICSKMLKEPFLINFTVGFYLIQT